MLMVSFWVPQSRSQPNLFALAENAAGPALSARVTLNLKDNRCFFPITTAISRRDFAEYLTRHVEQRFILGLGSQGYAINPPASEMAGNRVDVAVSVTCFVYEHRSQLAFSFIPIINRLTTVGTGTDRAVEITPIDLDPLLGFYDGEDREAMRERFFNDLDRLVDTVSQSVTKAGSGKPN